MSHCTENGADGFIAYAKCDVEQSIASRFEHIVARSPQRIAVRTNGLGVTYDALNGLANSVADSLLKLKSAKTQPVGLILDQDIRTVSTILGVLKAGHFYVPIDPSYPDDRLSFILRDCESPIVIADGKYLSRARALAPRDSAVVAVENLQGGFTSGNPGVVARAGGLAALFYTSGSTGRPKGVMQTHRSVLHRVMVDTNCFRVSQDDRLSLLSSLGHSMSLRHLFGALLNGAAVCPFNVTRQGLSALRAWLATEEINVYCSVPAVFRELTDSLTCGDSLRSLRVLHLSGDLVTVDDFERYRRFCSAECVFANSLAASETGVLRMFVGGKDTHLMEPTVPVGHEVPDKQILILDDEGLPVGLEVTGEIAVRSEFLSPGYWRQPEVTSLAFRPDPNVARQRIYRTGDQGRLLSDGTLFIEGRKDFRVKIRGIRVELEEVEAALRLHPSVTQAVVMAHDDQPGDQRLMAYAVLVRGAAVTSHELRSFLADRLPAHMVPSQVMFLEKLPFSPHGKVDRQALPATDPSAPEPAAHVVAPQDDLERQLASLCESILGVRPIGASENLFDLGIDSLKALRLAALCEKRFGARLPPAALFGAPTIAQFAAAIRESSGREVWSSLVAVQPTGDKPPFFWIHGDCSNTFLSRLLGPDQPMYGLEHQGQNGSPALHSDVETIASYYIREMRRVQATGPYFVGGYSFGGVVALEVAQQLTRGHEQVALLALLDPPSLVPQGAGTTAPKAGNLAALTPTERLAYLRVRAIPRTARMLRWPALESAVAALVCRLQLALGLRLSVFVRTRHILEIYRSALGRYRPMPYLGRVILFKGEDRTYQLLSDWEQLMGPDCEVHIVPAPHTQMRDERCLPLWADKLKAGLERAQGEAFLDVFPSERTIEAAQMTNRSEVAGNSISERRSPSAPRALPNLALTPRL